MSTAAPRKQYECPHNKDPLSRMVIGLLGSAPPMVVFLDIHPLVWAPASGAVPPWPKSREANSSAMELIKIFP